MLDLEVDERWGFFSWITCAGGLFLQFFLFELGEERYIVCIQSPPVLIFECIKFKSLGKLLKNSFLL